MTLKRLHVRFGPEIAVHVAAHDGKTLLECRDAGAFLDRIGAMPETASIPADTCIRGVVTPSVGAVFEIMDVFGRAANEVLRLGPEEAEDLLREIW